MKKTITRERCPFTRCLHNHSMICDVIPYPREIEEKTGAVSLYCSNLILPEHIPEGSENNFSGGETNVRNRKTVRVD